MNKRIFSIAILFLILSFQVEAQELLKGKVEIRNARVDHREGVMYVALDIDITRLKIKANRSITMKPVLRDGIREEFLPAIEIMGRNRYYYYLRTRGEEAVAPAEWVIRRLNGEEQVITYRVSVPYDRWMSMATLDIDEDLCGCCNTVLDSTQRELEDVGLVKFHPVYVFGEPEPELVKIREKRGTAYLDFPLNLTDIHSDYHDNKRELEKISTTIQVIKEDKSLTIDSITIKGYASPEGPYSNNERLARERAETLSSFVKSLHEIDSNRVFVYHEAEDWIGLRAWVEKSELVNKVKILALIDDSRFTPDPKEWRMKTMYPKTYRYLLQHCYPYLRHSDYVITYTVKEFDVNEAREFIKHDSEKLSLSEMYAVSGLYEPGSPEYNELFMIAVRVFPENSVANLNAANVAMMEGRFEEASHFLEKAGDEPKAIHARGILAVFLKDYETADRLLKEAADKGVWQAEQNREQIKL